MGAWIEIRRSSNTYELGEVAPLVGAWIEIDRFRSVGSGGLGYVAPLVGAWIEIHLLEYDHIALRSLPSWERGLKYNSGSLSMIDTVSLPSWERGLK